MISKPSDNSKLVRQYTNMACSVLTLLCLSSSLPSGSAHAHAVVTEHSLKTTPVKPNHPTQVVLFFNSGVELKLSRVFLVSAGDIYHPVEISKGKKPGEVLIQLPALETGDYAIKYKVFAADGHFTENALRFHVGATSQEQR